MASPRPIRIGISCCLIHPDAERKVFKSKMLQFIEEKMALTVHRNGAIPLALPDLKDNAGANALVDCVDGLMLSGGADVSPRSYDEDLIDSRWPGDFERDGYERRLVDACIRQGKPVLGICRGIQLLNVALGGTLYQDIATQVPGSRVHRDWHDYEGLEHTVRLEDPSWPRSIYGTDELLVNTVHHQAIKDLAGGLRATAWAPDGIVEAVEAIDQSRWLVGIQWHPEWLDGSEQGGPHRPRGDPLIAGFVDVCRRSVSTR